MKNIIRVAAVGAAVIMASCNDSGKWHVKGSISDLNKDDIVVIEGNNQGYWYVMDTVNVSSDGSFDYSHDAQGYPDIYRLRVGESSVYFPIDSIETVTVTAHAPEIAAGYRLGGSPQAMNLAKVDSMLAASASAHGVTAVITDQNLKRQLGQMLLADPAGIVTYYIVSKNIGGKPLFNPSVEFDNRLIGAVANAFSEIRPSDPRTSYLKNLYLSNRKVTSKSTGEPRFVAKEVGAFDIRLYDNTGKEFSLLDVLDGGKVVILNFTAYGAEWSPALNVALNGIYEKYRASGLEIFQVSLDTDEYAWKQSAKNLPWITVLADVTNGARILSSYNVVSLPTVFVFNREGVVVERVTEIDQLDDAVARLL